MTDQRKGAAQGRGPALHPLARIWRPWLDLFILERDNNYGQDYEEERK